MEDVFCRAEGTGIGDLGVVVDEVELKSRCEQIGIAREIPTVETKYSLWQLPCLQHLVPRCVPHGLRV